MITPQKISWNKAKEGVLFISTVLACTLTGIQVVKTLGEAIQEIYKVLDSTEKRKRKEEEE